MAKSTQYDPSIIQKYADKLYSQAATAVFVMTLFGLIVGAGAGYGTADSLRTGNDSTKLIYALIGAVVLGLVGCAIGIAMAFKLKVKAQLALCQKKIEENTQGRAGN